MLADPGGTGEFRTFTDAFGVACNGKFSDVYLQRGDRIRVVTSGGGGYGDPLERDLERIAEDLRQGFISAAQAAEDYGLVFREGTGEIDEHATAQRRAALKGES
jgi:N-methylhydantoinase B